jgi:hypothetical protein
MGAGQAFLLRHPFSGKYDRAVVVSTEIAPASGIPCAHMKFSDGNKRWVAADRLRLIGQPFGVKRRYLRRLRKQVARAARQELGVELKGITIHNVPQHRILREYGDAVAGFHEPGTIWVERDLAQFERITTVHETVHDYTDAFADQVGTALNEALTEFFSYKVALKRLGFKKPCTTDSYYGRYRFAVRLSELVGTNRLEGIFFDDRETGALRELKRLVDARIGKGRFKRACTALEAGDESRALKILGPPRTDNPFARRNGSAPTRRSN